MTLTKSSLTELLERVEAATDRLDDETLGRLLCAVHGVRFSSVAISCGDDGSDEFTCYPTGANSLRFSDYRHRMPDVSLDAALALVERVLPGWCKSAVDLRPEPCEGYVWERGHVGNIQGKAPTPALAVLVAMLRALGDGHASCPS